MRWEITRKLFGVAVRKPHRKGVPFEARERQSPDWRGVLKSPIGRLAFLGFHVASLLLAERHRCFSLAGQQKLSDCDECRS